MPRARILVPLLMFIALTFGVFVEIQRMGRLPAEDAAVSDAMFRIQQSLALVYSEMNQETFSSDHPDGLQDRMSRLALTSDQVERLSAVLSGFSEMSRLTDDLRILISGFQAAVLDLYQNHDGSLGPVMARRLDDRYGDLVDSMGEFAKRYGDLRVERIRSQSARSVNLLAVWGVLATILGYWFVRLARQSARETEAAAGEVRRQQRNVRELSILSEMMGYINSEIEPERMMDSMLARAQELLRAECGFIVLLHPDSRIVEQYVSSSPLKDRSAEEWLNSGLFEDVLTGSAPLRFAGENPVRIALCPRGTHSLLAVPLISGSCVHGLLVLMNRREGDFDQDDEDTLLNFAFHAYQAIHLHSEVTRMASTDGLTGLSNHRVFQERLTTEIARHSRYSRMSVSLLMIDIDHFKSFNDNYGHQTGDKVLKQIAETLERMTRTIVDVAARYGGEEFVCILPETGPVEAELVAERIRAKIERDGFRLDSGQRVNLLVSVGVASCPEDTQDKDELIRCADAALYEAKKNGRNQVCRYEPRMRSNL